MIKVSFNTKRIGGITETSVMLAFQKLGISVSKPTIDNEAYDLIVAIETEECTKLLRVQCKTSCCSKRAKGFWFSTRSTNYKGRKICFHSYTESEIDFYATQWNGKVYLFPRKEFNQKVCIKVYTGDCPQKKCLIAEKYEIRNTLVRMYGEFEETKTDFNLKTSKNLSLVE